MRDIRPNPTILVSGFLEEILGIGLAGRLTVDALQKAKIQVVCDNLRPRFRRLLTSHPARLDFAKDCQIWLIHANPPEAEIALYAYDYIDWKDLYRIGYWAWESSVAPTSWVRTAQWFHEIWAPSHFVRDALARAFQENGAAEQISKLRVVPHPVSSTGHEITSRETKHVDAIVMFDPRSDFNRKNPEASIRAWMQALPSPNGYATLTVKSLGGNESAELARLRHIANERRDITFITETMTPDALHQLISRCDILLSLHRAEGFGLPLAEAMAQGLSVVATGWSGNCDFMTSGNSMLIPYALVPATARYNGPHAQWAEPDVTAAAIAIHTLIAQPELRHRLGKAAKVDISKLNSKWTTAALFGKDRMSSR